MYALPNKTQHKLIVKARGGISQKLDNFSAATATAKSTSTSNPTGISSSSSTLSSSLTTSSSSPFKASNLIDEPALNRHIDEAGFNAELNYLPQPVFHSVNQHGNKPKPTAPHLRAQKQYITPEHNEMIRYVQQSWKGVERDYKKSVNNFINNLDLNSSSEHISPAHLKQKQVNATKKKTATTSTPLLLSGSYHHTSINTKDSSSNRQDSFQPFDLETFWGNRILKRLTEEL